MAEDPDAAPGSADGIQDPPRTIGGILKRLGPGLIVAGSIVGSGELIATTAVGAEAGFWLLWLIVIGCVIKVFTQVELGRYSIVTGHTTLDGMSEVPGPAIEVASRIGHGAKKARGNWLVWYWLAMFLASLAQLGGIVGGVGQALSISVPITADGKAYNDIIDNETQITVKLRELQLEVERVFDITPTDPDSTDELRHDITGTLARDHEEVTQLFRGRVEERLAELARREDWTRDGNSWRTIFEVVTSTLPADLRTRALGVVTRADGPLTSVSSDRVGVLRGELEQLSTYLGREKPDQVYDDRIWATVIAIATALILVLGRYGLIQTFSTVMVFLFTVITIINLISLQSTGAWAVTWDDLANGLRFRLPPLDQITGGNPLRTALFTFGIIGVGASELVTYPYWCIEKGYARFTGPRDDSEAWAERARGWMRVMRWDAWCSMVVYTFATVAFYLLGAAILWRTGLNPSGTEMIRTLAVMYEPVFGTWAPILFLFGAFAVLYSTFFVANASHARVFPDALRVFGIGIKSREDTKRWVRVFSGIFPFACLIVYLFVQAPKQLVLLSGMMQAIMLPMLAGAALWFRFRRCDPRIQPRRAWDIWLWVSAVGMLITGAAAIYAKLS